MAFELAAIQAKYAEEAQKRLRPDGTAQFLDLETSGEERLRHLVDDVWADHAALDAETPPLKDGDRAKFLIAGAGIGGLVTAAKLVQVSAIEPHFFSPPFYTPPPNFPTLVIC